MILDRLDHGERYRQLSPRLWQGLEFLRATDLLQLAIGKHTIDGDQLFALVQEYTSKPLAEGRYEAHRKYCDIQVVASGVEACGWAPLAKMQETITYSDERDIAFFSGQGDLFTLAPGLFAVFFPQDAHMPSLQAVAPAVVKKVVIKVAV